MTPVRIVQPRLFPDPQPLVERLGRDFFLSLPETPGVYLMQDREANVLYVGKAKNLRKRVCTYRVANPERMARRTLRLLRLVESIRWEECSEEMAALRRESELLLALKPRFNRAGVWRGPDRYLAWRCTGGRLELAVNDIAETDWQSLGPMGSQARIFRVILVRLFWFVAQPHLGFSGMPVGWAKGLVADPASLALGQHTDSAIAALDALRAGNTKLLCDWFRAHIPPSAHPFARTAAETDLELLSDMRVRQPLAALTHSPAPRVT